MGSNRLFQMVYLLLENRHMTAPQLAKHFEVTPRTIYRDIDTLSAAGIPVYATPGKSGGIFVRENFVLDQSLLTEAEQTHLLMALQGASLVDAELHGALLSKLSGAFERQVPQWIEVDFSDWRPDHKEKFDLLKHSIFQRTRITFSYHSGKGEATDRTAEPLKLVFKSDAWFLYAYCCLRMDYRLFKLARIRQLKQTQEPFDREAPATLFDKSPAQTVPLITVSLLFEADMAYLVYEQFERVKVCGDGRLRVEAQFPDNGHLYRHLLSYGEAVEVIHPPSVRKVLSKKLKKMMKKYKT